jgi:hypothetical protein
MFAAQRLMVILALAGTVHSAAADEATDAVQVLSKLWTGTDFGGSATQFVGDSTSFRMRVVTRNSDGTVSVATSEAPFGFLDENLDATPSAAWHLIASPSASASLFSVSTSASAFLLYWSLPIPFFTIPDSKAGVPSNDPNRRAP